MKTFAKQIRSCRLIPKPLKQTPERRRGQVGLTRTKSFFYLIIIYHQYRCTKIPLVGARPIAAKRYNFGR
ncbi:MAG: hypothetical protein A4E63_03387 [Syntrophorhabdus sp. PtaU1.Bin050]|nr:MAG: hypothetical protein A4E63_03387 [Syntrophorhabdus sp. PtaU1.Bin050]